LLRNYRHDSRVLGGLLAFLDVLLRRPTAIVEGDHALVPAGQDGDGKADRGIKFAGIPFDFGNDRALLVPRTGLIAEAGVIAPYMVRRVSEAAPALYRPANDFVGVLGLVEC
jgi:hypothetical protein